MSEQTESLILEILKRMQSDMSDMKTDMKEMKLRTTVIDGHLAGVMASLGIMNDRIDRVETRVTRIDARLELADAR